MPIVRIDIEAGKSTAYKRAILHAVRAAITDVLSVHDDRVVSRIFETPAENIDATEVRTDRLTVVEISMLAGRDAEKKAALFDAIVSRLGKDPGIAPHDVFVVVIEPPADCLRVAAPSSAPDKKPAEEPAT